LPPGRTSACGCLTSRRDDPGAAVTEDRFPHLSATGDARMVDVTEKAVTARSATAAGRVLLSAGCVAALRDGSVPKGDALAVARIAGIQAAKKTPDLIPLCHPLFISGVDVTAEVTDDGVEITATVKTTERTGVEMEALTAVAVAGLAVIDMIKAIDRAAVISDVRVLTKAGGRRGSWSREDDS
jgi:cyclic pyranopterin phosphate synthase